MGAGESGVGSRLNTDTGDPATILNIHNKRAGLVLFN